MLRFHDNRITDTLLEKNLNAFYNAHQQKKLLFSDSNPPFFIETIECLNTTDQLVESIVPWLYTAEKKG
jgi:hypothetical protein